MKIQSIQIRANYHDAEVQSPFMYFKNAHQAIDYIKSLDADIWDAVDQKTKEAEEEGLTEI